VANQLTIDSRIAPIVQIASQNRCGIVMMSRKKAFSRWRGRSPS
jgi:hypothetical protein